MRDVAEYPSGDEPLAVERHDRVIGLHFPVRADKDEARRGLDGRIDATLEELLARTGMAPEEFAKAFETEPPCRGSSLMLRRAAGRCPGARRPRLLTHTSVDSLMAEHCLVEALRNLHGRIDGVVSARVGKVPAAACTDRRASPVMNFF